MFVRKAGSHPYFTGGDMLHAVQQPLTIISVIGFFASALGMVVMGGITNRTSGLFARVLYWLLTSALTLSLAGGSSAVAIFVFLSGAEADASTLSLILSVAIVIFGLVSSWLTWQYCKHLYTSPGRNSIPIN